MIPQVHFRIVAGLTPAVTDLQHKDAAGEIAGILAERRGEYGVLRDGRPQHQGYRCSRKANDIELRIS